jgi:hypothetical protein
VQHVSAVPGVLAFIEICIADALNSVCCLVHALLLLLGPCWVV